MKIFLSAIFFLVCSLTLFSQSIEELEKQLQETETSKEKMQLNYQLGEANLRVDRDKALDYAKKAYQLSLDQNNSASSALSAYLVARAYERKRDDRNAEVWLKTTLKFAKQAGDSDLIIKSVDKRSRIATKSRKWQRAYEINQEAFSYFSQKGTSISDLEGKYDLQKTQLDREKRELEKQRDKLEFEVANLRRDKNQLTDDKFELETRQTELVEEKQKVEEKISEKEEALADVEEQREEAERLAQKNEQEIKRLNRAKLEEKALHDATRADLAETKLTLSEEKLSKERSINQRNYIIFGAGAMVLLALLFYIRFRAKKRAHKELEQKNKAIQQERERSDELLLNILPTAIANELKVNGKAKARHFEETSVFFSDFVNFTRLSEQLSPEELVEELDKCFKAFDFILSQYDDIEKIKTIGDAYMCASGLSDRRVFPYNLIRAGLEMQEFLQDQKQERMRIGKPYFEARMGIHTGPVVAGIVGVKKFAYDIWGDTVNIAARMESNCEAGRINISESTHNLVQYKFNCEHRGKVEAKNKGAIDMYYVKDVVEGIESV